VSRLEPSILEISSASLRSLFKVSFFFLPKSVPSLKRQIQYLVSFADFKAISKNFIKSLLELAALASMILAPILVADLLL